MHISTIFIVVSCVSLSLAAKLKWFGVNLSGAEFGEQNKPGVYGTDYIWYDHGPIDTLLGQGLNIFRVNFLMERLVPNNLNGNLDQSYLGNLTENVNYITSKGAYAMVQPHNYGRYYDNVISDTAAFEEFWRKTAAPFAQNNLVIFDTNNEYHDMDQNLVVRLNQAAINGIRAAGATSQYITPEGNAWSGAWSWISSGNAASLLNLTDPSDASGSKLVYQMHQYLDSDSSGTSENCVSGTIFRERLVEATNWLKQNRKLGIIGEYAGGSNSQCITALKDGLQYLDDNADVWTGAIWWASGPWWHDYIYSMEPPDGIAYRSVLQQILPYA